MNGLFAYSANTINKNADIIHLEGEPLPIRVASKVIHQMSGYSQGRGVGEGGSTRGSEQSENSAHFYYHHWSLLSCFQVVNAQPSTIQYSVGVMPESYMGLSIFTCLCCCWLFGLIAIMFSSQVSGCLHAMEPPIGALRERDN